MANIDNVQLPDGSSYNIVDNTSGFATQNYVDSAVDSVTKTTIGLGNVDNTSDLDKPVSTAQQTAIDTAVATKVNKTDIAPVEDSSTASQTYQIGDQFYYNGLLYKATAVINSGGTITINGNCSAANPLTKQLKSLDSLIGDNTNTESLSFKGLIIVIIRRRKVCEIKVWSGAMTSKLTAYTAYTVGTIPSGYRPKYTLTKCVAFADGILGILDIQTSGVVTIRPFADIPTGSTPLLHETYIVT